MTPALDLSDLLPFRVLVTVRVALHGALLDQELHLLVEAGGDAGRRLPQQDVQRVGRGETHERVATHFLRTALAVCTVHQAV